MCLQQADVALASCRLMLCFICAMLQPANDEGPSSGASMLAVTAMSLLLSMNTMMASPALATDCEVGRQGV
jgi:hypothetical protein